jgi:hypothetical protein
MLQHRHDPAAPVRGEVHTRKPRLFKPGKWGGAALVLAVLAGLVVFNVLVFFVALAGVAVIGAGLGLYSWRHRWRRVFGRGGAERRPALHRRGSKEIPAS